MGMIKCPLCEELAMEYKHIGEEPKVTHAWVCIECPGVLVEWYQKDDTERLAEYLQRPWADQSSKEESLCINTSST